jgi:hypothetical protein
MHTRTDARWDQVRELKPFILETLPIIPLDRSTDKSRDFHIQGEVYDEYEDPIYIMARKVHKSMSSYNNHYYITPDIKHLSRPIPSLKQENHLL